ncbi:MAG: pilus assembly protein PilN [Gammaproteobacteria bacterium HGW-Gammaproteobacteria-14]|nr:MAG: pilus assembly protein PilN [Gammaproteobacteria bacterium HGW-Gammaproteobacteria-14]
MTSINLRPWREERRQKQQLDFMIMLAVAAALAVVVFVLWNGAVGGQVTNQQERNRYIERELAQLDQQIKEISELESRRAELVSRMNVIQNLQNSRPFIVYIFDQLVRTLPDGVYYTSIERKGTEITIQGIADSNNRISALMRNLNESDWFRDPDLRTVTAAADGSQSNSFVLTVRQENKLSPEPAPVEPAAQDAGRRARR